MSNYIIKVGTDFYAGKGRLASEYPEAAIFDDIESAALTLGTMPEEWKDVQVIKDYGMADEKRYAQNEILEMV